MNKNNSTVLIYLFFFSLLEMILTFLIKYDLNSISISEFNILFIGNILPISIEIVLIILILMHLFIKKNIHISHRISIFIVISASFTLLLVGYITNKIGYQFNDNYIFNFPIKRVVTGGSLMFSFFLKIYLITLLINLFFNNSFVVYLKSLLSTLSVFILAFLTIFVLTTKNGFVSTNLKPSSSSIAVVLGAAVWNDKPSTLLIGRTKKASELLIHKKIAKIQFTGSNAPGEISEASAAYNYAISLGVKKHLLAIEETTTTTTEQIKFIKKNLVKIQGNYSVIIISDQFHLTRVLEICKFFDVYTGWPENDP